jgi:hypothetical protein
METRSEVILAFEICGTGPVSVKSRREKISRMKEAWKRSNQIVELEFKSLKTVPFGFLSYHLKDEIIIASSCGA